MVLISDTITGWRDDTRVEAALIKFLSKKFYFRFWRGDSKPRGYGLLSAAGSPRLRFSRANCKKYEKNKSEV